MGKNRFCLVALLLLLVGSIHAGSMRLDYTTPAGRWEEGLPIGNGYIGAVVWGSPINERIQFNEKSLVNGDTVRVGYYQPFGNIILTTGHKSYSGYYRYLSLDSASYNESYVSDGIRYNVVTFVSYPDNVLVVRLTA